jgi:type I restriction enzyme S subunit
MSDLTRNSQSKKVLSPELRFKSFQDEWRNIKMSDVITFISGFAFESSKMLSQTGKYQLIKMSNVYKSELQLDRSPSYWNQLDERNEKVLLRKGDIILTLTGTVGKRDYGYSVTIPEDDKFLLNQRLVCLRSKNDLTESGFINGIVKTSHFLYHFFNESKGGTGNQSNVGVEDLRNIKVAFPSLPEQQKIASFLSAVDEKIQQLTRKKELLEQYKKGVMQQLFSGKLRFKDKNGKSYPKWGEKRLGELITIQSGNTPSNSVFNEDGAYPFFKVEELNNTKKYQTRSRFYSNDGKDLIKKNSIVFPKRGAAIMNNKVRITKVDSFIDTNLMALTPRPEILHYEFLYYKIFDVKLYKIADSSTIPQINNKHIEPFKIWLPSLSEQQKIANFLSAIDSNIGSVSTKLEQTQNFKKGLLQQMFV